MPINKIQELLNTQIIQSIDTGDPKLSWVKLKEEGRGVKLRELMVCIPTHETVVFKLDSPKTKRTTGTSKTLFMVKESDNINSCCDYVIALEWNNKLWFCMCELKSNNTKGAVSQLYYSTPLIKYLLALLETHHKICKEFKRDCIVSYILFSTAERFNKQTTKYSISSKIDKDKGITYYTPTVKKQFHLSSILTCE